MRAKSKLILLGKIEYNNIYKLNNYLFYMVKSIRREINKTIGNFDPDELKRKEEERLEKIINAFANPNQKQETALGFYLKEREEIIEKGRRETLLDCGPCYCVFCETEHYGRTRGPQICGDCINIYESKSLFIHAKKKK